MFSRMRITNSTETYSDSINKLKKLLNEADAVIIGAGAGLSTSAGLSYSGERFMKFFSDFNRKYGITDMYSGGFYPYKTPEEFWAWWSRQIYVNRYIQDSNDLYEKLFELVKNKDYFVLTTNVDHCFQRAGFDKKRLFYTQGDYGLFQCNVPCCDETFDNEELIIPMLDAQEDMKIPTEYIPKCPHCGSPMTTNLRCDDKFVQDEGWYKASERYSEFLKNHEGMRILYLELGVGFNTPVIIKYPFWRYTAENEKANYVCINKGESYFPEEIKEQALGIDEDIYRVVNELVSE